MQWRLSVVSRAESLPEHLAAQLHVRRLNTGTFSCWKSGATRAKLFREVGMARHDVLQSLGIRGARAAVTSADLRGLLVRSQALAESPPAAAPGVMW